MIAKVANDALRLDQMKPTQRKHQITTSDNFETGQTKVNSMSFKNKIRSEQVRINDPWRGVVILLILILVVRLSASVSEAPLAMRFADGSVPYLEGQVTSIPAGSH